jgi:hypothetical protein
MSNTVACIRMDSDGQSYLPLSVSCIFSFRDFPSITWSDVNNCIMLRILHLPHERPYLACIRTIRTDGTDEKS